LVKFYGVGCSNVDYYLLNQDIIKVILEITLSLSFYFHCEILFSFLNVGYLWKKQTQDKGEIIFSSRRKVKNTLLLLLLLSMKGYLLHNIENENAQNLNKG
jgi:hypothetical protein